MSYDVLIGCEFSGRVRQAFTKLGINAVSCDLLPADDDGPHIKDDVLKIIKSQIWKLAILFPPCTHLASSGARWFSQKREQQTEAVNFFIDLWSSPVPRLAIENPIGIMSRMLRKPDQIIQPWQFGHGETKATCLWLRNLPPLQPTEIVEGRNGRVWKEPPSPDRWKRRSITYQGIADAMANQWSRQL